nr:caspase family protein [Reinekea sp. G2M2-21]
MIPSAKHYASKDNAIENVFSTTKDIQSDFRKISDLLSVDLPATPQSITNYFKETIAKPSNGDSVFMIYSGHGGRASTDPENSLLLWDDTRLTVNALYHTLKSQPNDSTVRFILPQCYSGAFALLPFNNLNPKDGLKSNGQVCGFTSVAEDSIAEGCTVSINTDEYRDYGSAMMRAITNSDHSGFALTIDADFNKNGNVSLREAHLYTIGHTISTDIPRSTSEVFLLSTERWYERWQSYQPKGELNEFDHVAIELSMDFDSAFGTIAYNRELNSRVTTSHTSYLASEKMIQEQEESISSIKTKLREEILSLWPQLASPYRSDFSDFYRDHRLEINQWIEQKDLYQDLVNSLSDLEHFKQNAVDDLRSHIRFRRIQHLLKLSRLHESINNKDREINQQYNKLRQCEEWELP